MNTGNPSMRTGLNRRPIQLLTVAVAGLALFGAACSSRPDTSAPPAGGTPAADTAATNGGAAVETAASRDLSVAGVVDLAADSVVRIQSQGAFGGGVGSGFVVGADGYIMTNNHVIADLDGSIASNITVTLSDGGEFPATVVGNDPSTDSAILKIDASGLTPLAFADIENVAVGQEVVAIGYPLDLDGGEGSGITVTTGIVSAKNRYIREPNGQNILGAIQTDAAINQGNSGGPLLNMAGQVIGMNTAIATNPDSSGVAPGIGFAISSATLDAVHSALMEHGSVDRGFLGIANFSALRPAEATARGIPADGGVVVGDVAPGSPVESIGMQADDVIVKLGDVPIADEADLGVALIRHTAGETVQIQFYRGDQLMTEDLTLGTATT